jgi:hypothetical protein
MEARKDRWPDLPHVDEPGCCPRCGTQLRPDADAVHAGGSWSKNGPRGGMVTGGHLFQCQCPQCESSLLAFPDGWPPWRDIDPSQVRWYPHQAE